MSDPHQRRSVPLSDADRERLLRRAAEGVGGTPVLRLETLFADTPAEVWAKLELRNPTGSAKDRSALGMVSDAWRSGRLNPRSVVVESSSGNLAIAMARLAALLGFEFHCVVDPRTNQLTLRSLRAQGAVVHPVTEPDPETGDWLVARLNLVRQLVDELPAAVNLDQYANPAAPAAHARGTMREVVDQVGAPTRMYVAMSTTGTIGGCRRLIDELELPTELVGVDAPGSVLFGGERGTRHLPGYGAGIVPALAEWARPGRVVRVPDLDAVVHCRALARAEGLLAGASTGAVVAAARADAASWRPGETAVVVVHDGGLGYLDTVYDDAWVLETFDVDADELARRVDGVLGEA